MTYQTDIQDYIKHLVERTGFTAAEIHAFIHGYTPEFYYSRFSKLIQAIGNDAHGVILCSVWKGTADPKHLRSAPTYYSIGHITQGLDLFLYKAGYTSRLFITNETIVSHGYIEDVVLHTENVGLINLTYLSQKLFDVFSQIDCPIVHADCPAIPDITPTYLIGLDVADSFADAVTHLYELGHRRIALITGPLLKRSGIDRYRGYCEGIKKVGLQLDDDLIFKGNWYEPTGRAAAEAFLSLDNPPTAIIASNDLMAMGAMQAIQHRGLTVPGDISVIGFDDIAAASVSKPPLTTVRVPKAELGAKLGEYIAKLLEGETPSPPQLYLPVEIIHRASTGKAPSHLN